jgi:DNA polymerase III delta subunit
LLIFLFGENIVESRKKLQELVETYKKNAQVQRIDKCNTATDFDETLKSESLFETEKIIIFENFFKGKTPKWKNEIDFQKLEADKNIYIFWDSADPNAALKRSFLTAKKQNVFNFKIPGLLWVFLDGITPCSVGNGLDRSLQNIKNFRELCRSTDPDMIFLMMIRQFRLLILSKKEYKEYPSEYTRLTFQKYKLKSQAAHFTEEQLLKAYKKLLEIEEHQKTGSGIYDFPTEIEKFLLFL